MRIASSLRRVAARASSRFATFAQATSRTSYREIAEVEGCSWTSIRRSILLCLSQMSAGERLERLRFRMANRTYLLYEDAYFDTIEDMFNTAPAQLFKV